MKKVLVFILIVAGVVATFDLFAGDKKDQDRKKYEERVQKAIASKEYKIEVNRVLTSRGSTSLSFNYSLEIDKDKVSSYLPYFGRAYSIPYGGGSGLVFDSTSDDYEVTKGKKGMTRIKFKTRSTDDNYKFNIEIYENGSCRIFISPNNRQSITFNGSIKFDEESSKKR